MCSKQWKLHRFSLIVMLMSIANGTEWPGVFISAIHWFQTVQCVFVWPMVITFWDDMMLSSFKKWYGRVLKWIFNYYHVGTPHRRKWTGSFCFAILCCLAFSSHFRIHIMKLWKFLDKNALKIPFIRCDNTQLTGKQARIYYNPVQSNTLADHVETKSLGCFFLLHSSV